MPHIVMMASCDVTRVEFVYDIVHGPWDSVNSLRQFAWVHQRCLGQKLSVCLALSEAGSSALLDKEVGSD